MTFLKDIRIDVTKLGKDICVVHIAKLDSGVIVMMVNMAKIMMMFMMMHVSEIPIIRISWVHGKDIRLISNNCTFQAFGGFIVHFSHKHQFALILFQLQQFSIFLHGTADKSIVFINKQDGKVICQSCVSDLVSNKKISTHVNSCACAAINGERCCQADRWLSQHNIHCDWLSTCKDTPTAIEVSQQLETRMLNPTLKLNIHHVDYATEAKRH